MRPGSLRVVSRHEFSERLAERLGFLVVRRILCEFVEPQGAAGCSQDPVLACTAGAATIQRKVRAGNQFVLRHRVGVIRVRRPRVHRLVQLGVGGRCHWRRGRLHSVETSVWYVSARGADAVVSMNLPETQGHFAHAHRAPLRYASDHYFASTRVCWRRSRLAGRSPTRGVLGGGTHEAAATLARRALAMLCSAAFAVAPPLSSTGDRTSADAAETTTNMPSKHLPYHPSQSSRMREGRVQGKVHTRGTARAACRRALYARPRLTGACCGSDATDRVAFPLNFSPSQGSAEGRDQQANARIDIAVPRCGQPSVLRSSEVLGGRACAGRAHRDHFQMLWGSTRPSSQMRPR